MRVVYRGAKRLLPETSLRIVRKWTTKEIPPITGESKERLAAIFADEFEDIRRLTGISFENAQNGRG